MIRHLIVFAIIALLITSCFKEDEPLPAFPMQTTTVAMGNTYLYQVYFNLADNEAVSTNEKNIFDLGFECADSGWHIRLNTAAFMMAGNTGEKDLAAVTDTTGLLWKYDKSNGNPDSTAIGQWLDINGNDTTYKHQVYVLNRGYDHLGNVRGLRKIVFTHVDTTSFSFEYSDMNGDNYGEFKVIKNNTEKYTYFSFNDGGQQLNLEPPAHAWDLLFTQYTTLLFTNEGEPYPYLVTGVLSNYGDVTMAMDSTISYDNIDLAVAKSHPFTEARDFIGYDWKEVLGDVNSGNVYYEIVQGRTYLIRTREGLYFKLRFINFYSDDGDKGYPTFQYDVL